MNGHKTLKKILIIFCALVVGVMLVNWVMTYLLEDTLRKRLHVEIHNATDGFYDFSFDQLKVGLFNGELMIKGLTLSPNDSLASNEDETSKLPDLYFDVYVDTLHFKGVNLTWLFNYRSLSFDRFLLKSPTIKIHASHYEKEGVQELAPPNKSLYEIISPFFDIIRADKIVFNKASVDYIVTDSTTSTYRLRDFDFIAYNFLLDEHAQEKEHLLFSDNFEFVTKTPQAVYDSDHFLLNIKGLELSTQDSTINLMGTHLQPKEKYWSKRYEEKGSYVDVKVGGVVLNGIALSRQGTSMFLKARSFKVRHPQIQSFYVADSAMHQKQEVVQSDTAKVTVWSLYSIVSPIFEQIKIDSIDVDAARFRYSKTKNKITDEYTLRKLNFFAQNFQVDSLSHNYNFFLYVKDFSVDATNVFGLIPSKNVEVSVDQFLLSSIDQRLKISNMSMSPIQTTINNDYLSGSIDEIEITDMQYEEGVDANLLSIVSPKINFIKGKNAPPKKKKSVESNNAADNILDAIAPFVGHLSVKNIRISDGNVSLLDRLSNNTYKISNVDFYAKNFYLDKETRQLRDYFFDWDEFTLRFRDFNNLTPDKKYRIQISEGDFSSVTGNMLLRDLKFKPEDEQMGSYISVVTPFASLLGFDEKAIREKRLYFRSFTIHSPVVELLKGNDHVAKEVTKGVSAVMLKSINFDLLSILNPSVFVYNEVEGSSTMVQTEQVQMDSFRWELNKSFNIHNLEVKEPYLSIVETKEKQKSQKQKRISIASFGNVEVGTLNITKPIVKIKKPNSYLDLSSDNLFLNSLYWNHQVGSVLNIGELDSKNPKVFYAEHNVVKNPHAEPMTREKIINELTTYANKTHLGRVNIANVNLKYDKKMVDGSQTNYKLKNTSLLVEGLHSDLIQKKLLLGNLAFSTIDLSIPVDSFYVLSLGDIAFSSKNGTLDVNDIKLTANYPKFEFAYRHPKGADWFNLGINKVLLTGIDLSLLFSDSIVLVDKMLIEDVLLENLKNQKIIIEHNKMPLLYEQFHTLPIRYNVGDLDIRNFTVLYEELARNGFQPSRIPFANMNGRVQGFTNIQTGKNEFYDLHVDGLAMGTSPFTAKWTIPIDSINDKFFLSAEIKELDMRDLNQLVRPMAPGYVRSGRIQSLAFQTEASSQGARVDMQFTYDSLYFVLLKGMDTHKENKFMTYVINKWGIEGYNRGKDMRAPQMQIVRDPYHSNFNYFWQIIQPPLVTSVGVTEEKQNLAHNLGVIFKRIKRFFGGGKKEAKKEAE